MYLRTTWKKPKNQIFVVNLPLKRDKYLWILLINEIQIITEVNLVPILMKMVLTVYRMSYRHVYYTSSPLHVLRDSEDLDGVAYDSLDGSHRDASLNSSLFLW